MSLFSHLSHTQMFGEERRSRRGDRGESRGAQKVKETTFEEETKKGRKASDTEKKMRRRSSGQRMENKDNLRARHR